MEDRASVEIQVLDDGLGALDVQIVNGFRAGIGFVDEGGVNPKPAQIVSNGLFGSRIWHDNHARFSIQNFGGVLGIVLPREKIVDGFLQRIVFSQRASLLRNNPEKNNYSPSKATPDPIIRSYSLYHGLIVHLPSIELASIATLARIFR